MSRHFKWTRPQLDKLDAVREVLADLEEYKPLTLRQVYYQLVGKGVIENTVSQYTMLSNLLKWARLDGYVSWEDIEDRVRAVHDGEGWWDSEQFIKAHLEHFLDGYRRHLLQSQDVFLEVWIEKDALSRLFSQITTEYCVSTVVCRGFSSISFLHDYQVRAEWHQSQGRQPVMLYFGDFDPSGNEMALAMGTTLREEMRVEDLCIKKIALTLGDITKYNLPHDPRALKKKDTRARKHVEQYGLLAVELDALSPDVLEEKIRGAIGAEIDVDLSNREQEIERRELTELAEIKGRVSSFIENELL